MQQVSVSKWAESVGISRQAGHQAVARCKIPQDQEGRVDPDVATFLYRQRTRARAPNGGSDRAPDSDARMAIQSGPTPASAAPAPPAASDDYSTARARRERAEAEEAELRVARAAGRSLDRERAERGAFDAFRELRDAAFSAVRTQARKVIGLTEVRDVEHALEDELRGVFSGWEERMQRRLQEAAGE